MNYTETLFRLQKGINQTERFRVLLPKSQFYSKEQRRPVNIYSVEFAVDNPETGKTKNEKVYRTGVQLYIVFFLRNLWFYINGTPIPSTDFPDFEKDWKKFYEEDLPMYEDMYNLGQKEGES